MSTFAKDTKKSLKEIKSDSVLNKAAERHASKALTIEMKDELKRAKADVKIAKLNIKNARTSD